MTLFSLTFVSNSSGNLVESTFRIYSEFLHISTHLLLPSWTEVPLFVDWIIAVTPYWSPCFCTCSCPPVFILNSHSLYRQSSYHPSAQNPSLTLHFTQNKRENYYNVLHHPSQTGTPALLRLHLPLIHLVLTILVPLLFIKYTRNIPTLKDLALVVPTSTPEVLV